MRWLLVLTLPLIAACEGDKVPDKPAVPTPPKLDAPLVNEAVRPEPVELPAQAESGPAPIDIDIEVEPVPVSGDQQQLPSERVAPAPSPPAKPAAAAVAKQKVEKVQLPEADLDLSLPEDWHEALDTSDDQASMSLLPPLFEPSRNPRSMQMSGELLQDLPQTDAIIDGAQLNFEFKR